MCAFAILSFVYQLISFGVCVRILMFIPDTIIAIVTVAMLCLSLLLLLKTLPIHPHIANVHNAATINVMLSRIVFVVWLSSLSLPEPSPYVPVALPPYLLLLRYPMPSQEYYHQH